MTAENLASVFAPNVLRQADYDPDVEMSVTPVITLTIAGFIRRHTELFRYDLSHFAQLRGATTRSASTVSACGSTAAAATFTAYTDPGNDSADRVDSAILPASAMQTLKVTRQNFSEPPTAITANPSMHFSRYKSGMFEFLMVYQKDLF